MKILSTKQLSNGKRVVRIELGPDEEVIPLRDGCFYRLGGQVDEVMPAHVLAEAALAVWDHFDQKWIA